MRVVNGVETASENPDSLPPKKPEKRFAFFGNAIRSAARKRITAQNPPCRQKRSRKKTVLYQGLAGIFRASRRKSAKSVSAENGMKGGRNNFLIKPDNCNSDKNARTPKNVRHVLFH